ncbi:hypothetical protein [Mycobacterium sp.]|uniref:hypothetical protein n=1 Tax=Mycobacterium sp. TaxID=1785 RepID=UPI002C846BC5|nr:hypothetical protein [Mycobacterium sp.]HTQ18381.1 hypothetical protein [Mycobacterium sp.]
MPTRSRPLLTLGWECDSNSSSTDGNGHFTHADFDTCPSSAMASVPRATANFALTSVSGSTASGTITGDTGAGGHQGQPVSVTL